MPLNVEIKARICGDPQALRTRARALGTRPAMVMHQEDTFFRTVSGRLKLRVPDCGGAELIYYERRDEPGPRPSVYFVAPVDDPVALKAVLSAALGVRGVVRKRRELVLAGNTRIHVDDVEGLGSFLELEVMLSEGEAPEVGNGTCARFMHVLGVGEDDLVDSAYIDLIDGGDAAAPGGESLP
jgi:adenylate cyclase class IV